MLNSDTEQKLAQEMERNIGRITSEILWRHGRSRSIENILFSCPPEISLPFTSTVDC